MSDVKVRLIGEAATVRALVETLRPRASHVSGEYRSRDGGIRVYVTVPVPDDSTEQRPAIEGQRRGRR